MAAAAPKPAPAGNTPKPVLWSVALVMAGSFALAASHGLSRDDREPGLIPSSAVPGFEPAVSRAVTFADREDGAVLALDAETGDVLAVHAKGEGGFVRGLARGLARERARRGVGPAEPFVLVRAKDGRLRLDDPAVGGGVPLDGFGRDNRAIFERLLAAGPVPEAR